MRSLPKIMFYHLVVILGFVFVGCDIGNHDRNDKNQPGEKTPAEMIRDLADAASSDAPWEFLSWRGVQVSDAIRRETNLVERLRLLSTLSRAIREFKEPGRGKECRLRRVWALQSIIQQMRRSWWELDRPEKVVDDYMFVLGEFKEVLVLLDPDKRKKNVPVGDHAVNGPQCAEYEKAITGFEAMARLFEDVVLPRAQPKLMPKERKHIEARFTEVVGRPVGVEKFGQRIERPVGGSPSYMKIQ